MGIASLIISIVAILLSLFATFLQIKNSKKINDINLEADLLKSLFTDSITKEIPDAYSNICFPDGVLSKTNDLQDSINQLLIKMRFFKYYDKAFYESIKEKGQALEDYIVENDGKHFEVDDYSKVTDKISMMISDIYYLIKMKYHDGKSK